VSARGLLLERTGRAEEAEQLLRSAAASGDRRYHLKLWIGVLDERAAYLPA